MNIASLHSADNLANPSSEFEMTRALLDLACPTKEDAPFFNHCMRLAKEMGMSWEEGLRYTIEQRRAGRRADGWMRPEIVEG